MILTFFQRIHNSVFVCRKFTYDVINFEQPAQNLYIQTKSHIKYISLSFRHHIPASVAKVLPDSFVTVTPNVKVKHVLQDVAMTTVSTVAHA